MVGSICTDGGRRRYAAAGARQSVASRAATGTASAAQAATDDSGGFADRADVGHIHIDAVFRAFNEDKADGFAKMRVRMTGAGEYDHHDGVVRCTALVDATVVNVTIDNYALFIAGEALQQAATDPITMYAVAGRLLEEALSEVVKSGTTVQPSYFLAHSDILRITGLSGAGNSHVPKRWTSSIR